jgi:hypothetical protein
VDGLFVVTPLQRLSSVISTVPGNVPGSSGGGRVVDGGVILAGREGLWNMGVGGEIEKRRGRMGKWEGWRIGKEGTMGGIIGGKWGIWKELGKEIGMMNNEEEGNEEREGGKGEI